MTHYIRAIACALILLLTSACSAPGASDTTPAQGSTTAGQVDASITTDDVGASGTAGPAATDNSAATRRPEAKEDPPTTLAATAVDAEVAVRTKPDGEVLESLRNPTPTGVPLTFMVLSAREGWLRVQVPVRPNGTTGWVAEEDVALTEISYSLKVSTADNTLELYEGDSLVQSFSVATGTGDTPTPLGTFYLTELIEPTNAGYGPFAYGISAFSDVLNEFGGGPGQIGLHGTEERDSVGQAVSHGCLRLANEDIIMLSELLPLGTPIVIA